MKPKFIDYYMNVALLTARLSSAVRLQVGAIAVKDDRIISIGYNGMPSGWTNVCEDRVRNANDGGHTLVTKPEVLHAEMNCLMKLARSVESGLRSTMFVTHAPCLECAKGIYQAGISTVYYRNQYRLDTGIKFLEQCDVSVEQV